MCLQVPVSQYGDKPTVSVWCSSDSERGPLEDPLEGGREGREGGRGGREMREGGREEGGRGGREGGREGGERGRGAGN